MEKQISFSQCFCRWYGRFSNSIITFLQYQEFNPEPCVHTLPLSCSINPWHILEQCLEQVWICRIIFKTVFHVLISDSQRSWKSHTHMQTIWIFFAQISQMLTFHRWEFHTVILGGSSGTQNSGRELSSCVQSPGFIPQLHITIKW